MAYIKIDTSKHPIETERLLLRAWKVSDLKDFNEYASVEGVGEAAGWHHHQSMEESEKILNRFIENDDDYAVVLKETGKVIGSFGFHSSTWIDEDSSLSNSNYTSIGYVLSKAYWGKSLMPEALNAVIKYLFDNDVVESIAISHFLENDRSRRVIEKAGFSFVREGTHKTRMVDDNGEPIIKNDKKYLLLKMNFKDIFESML